MKDVYKRQVYLLEQCVVWQRLSVHLGWQCDNVRASYDEIPKATQDEVFSGARAFGKKNKGRYECGGYIYSGEGQELGQFWALLLYTSYCIDIVSLAPKLAISVCKLHISIFLKYH